MIQPHVKPSEYLCAHFGVQVCKYHLRVLAEFFVEHGHYQMLRRIDGLTECDCVFFFNV